MKSVEKIMSETIERTWNGASMVSDEGRDNITKKMAYISLMRILYPWMSMAASMAKALEAINKRHFHKRGNPNIQELMDRVAKNAVGALLVESKKGDSGIDPESVKWFASVVEHNEYAISTRVERTSIDGFENRLATAHAINGMMGELGELMEGLIPWMFKGESMGEDEKQEIVDEMGDVLYYLHAMAKELDIDLREVAKRNQRKLFARHKGGFNKNRE